MHGENLESLRSVHGQGRLVLEAGRQAVDGEASNPDKMCPSDGLLLNIKLFGILEKILRTLAIRCQELQLGTYLSRAAGVRLT